MMKRLFVVLLASILLITVTQGAFAYTITHTSGAVLEIIPDLLINKDYIQFEDQTPIIVDGRILVPIRAIAEAMKFKVKWVEETQTITVDNDDLSVEMKIGSLSVTKKERGEKRTFSIDVPPAIYSDRTLIPLRAVAESFGADVKWIEKENRAKITYLGREVKFEDEAIAYCVKGNILHDADEEVSDVSGVFPEYASKVRSRDVEDVVVYENLLPCISQIHSEALPKNLKVNSIEDIKILPNLSYLYLEGQNITDIGPITYNHHWEVVNLAYNKITDVSVFAGLQSGFSCGTLILQGNKIENVSPLRDINIYSIMLPYSWNDFYYIDTKLTKDEIFSIHEKTVSVIKKVLSENITPKMTEREKVKAIHDWMVKNISYDYETIEAQKKGLQSFNPHPYTVQGTLLEGKSVCLGYAATFKAFCDMLDIECFIISGKAGVGNAIKHAWNIVKVDGKYFNIDVTWDDPDNGSVVKYVYFLKDDSFMMKNHYWDKEDMPI